MPLYHTTLFANDPPGDPFVSRGAAWSFEKESGLYRGPLKEMHDFSMKLFEERGHAATGNYVSDDVPVFFDMEIMIRAPGPAQAQRAVNLLISAMAVLEGSITFGPEPFSIELREAGASAGTRSYMSKSGLLAACSLANSASRMRSSSYALHKLALSYQSSSPHLMDLHPGESPRRFQVQTDPVYHVYLANAVTLAYSAIEELGLEIRANQKNPSKMPDGTWNPSVKADLEERLQESGIDIADTHIWTLRGPQTRIEKKRPPPSAGKPNWSRGNVRDVNVHLIDALALASWLRSTTTTHRFSDTARSLTVYDAHNVQSLARHLIMDKFGFRQLRTKPGLRQRTEAKES
ncbi:hypothetical protein [Bradyrhizobium sp. SRS-191]|uniref:hypothetical protein n=1 Tax=Bradyrhizobium sp. SRS-191 TaxID=2962606 RepID=UPI00211E6E15|nr:hypothetical protein [Bradyrhizobium sp. SRS-191]